MVGPEELFDGYPTNYGLSKPRTMTAVGMQYDGRDLWIEGDQDAARALRWFLQHTLHNAGLLRGGLPGDGPCLHEWVDGIHNPGHKRVRVCKKCSECRDP